MYNPEVKQYELNLKKAEELLVQLGYDILDDRGIRKNKDGSRLSFNLLVGGEVRQYNHEGLTLQKKVTSWFFYYYRILEKAIKN